MSRDGPLSRLTTASPAEVLELAAAGYPTLTLTPMQLAIPFGCATCESFVAESAGGTLALTRRKLAERAPQR